MKLPQVLSFLLVLLCVSPVPCKSHCDLHSDYEEVTECRMQYEAVESALVADKNNLYLLKEYFTSKEFYREVLYINYNVAIGTESASFSYQTGYSKHVLFTMISPSILGCLTVGESWFASDWTNLSLHLTNETEFDDTQDLKRTLDTLTTRLSAYATQHVTSYFGEKTSKEDLGYITLDSHEHNVIKYTTNYTIILSTFIFVTATCHYLIPLTMWFVKRVKKYERICPVKVHFYLSLFYCSGITMTIMKVAYLTLRALVVYHMSGQLYDVHFNTKMSHNAAPIIERVFFAGSLCYTLFGGVLGYVAHARINPPNFSYRNEYIPSVVLKMLFVVNFSAIYYFAYIFSQSIVPTFLMALIDPLRVLCSSMATIGINSAGILTSAFLFFPFTLSFKKVPFSRECWLWQKGPLLYLVYATASLLLVCGFTWTVPIRSDYSVLTQIAAAALPSALVAIIGYWNKANLLSLLENQDLKMSFTEAVPRQAVN